MTNRFKQDAPQAFSSSHVVIPDGTSDHRVFIRHALEGCREHQSPHYTTLWSDIPKTSVR